MKIIVDELPKSAEDCVFGSGDGELKCGFDNIGSCYDSKHCQYLKPITEFHAEETVGKCDDGTTLVRRLNIN